MSMRVMGWYNRANCGDDAFVDAFHELFPAERLSFYEPSTGLLQLDPNERLVLGGGDVIKHYYLRRIAERQPFWIIGCGLGYETEISQVAKLNVQGAILRNPSDVAIATAAGIPAIYAPDICFALPPLKPAEMRPSARKRLGVILSGHSTPGIEQPSIREASYFEYLQWELASTLDELVEYFEIHWISFSSDVDAWDETPHYSVRRKMTKRNDQTFWSYKPNKPMDQVKILAAMDLVFTMKFHGAIFSAIQGVPFVSIGQTRKLQEFCHESELDGVLVPAYEFSKPKVLRAVKQAELPGLSDRLRQMSLTSGAAVRKAIGRMAVSR